MPPYVKRPAGGVRWTWRLGGPMTSRHEAEARRELAQRRPGRLGRAILWVLGARRYDGPGRSPGAAEIGE
ncbi:MAG TPA: hypothetical protein VMB72_16655 [Acidimicrobiales bacterium]|nr:hypothetical protein [Acidimicrobiales bacterium]